MYLHFMAIVKFYRHVIKPVEFSSFFQLKLMTNSSGHTITSIIRMKRQQKPQQQQWHYGIIEIMTHSNLFIEMLIILVNVYDISE